MIVTDDIPGKSKKNNLNTPKLNNLINEECAKIDTNIVLIHEGNMRSSIFENYDLLSHQVVLQPNGSNIGQSMNFQNINTVQGNFMKLKKYILISYLTFSYLVIIIIITELKKIKYYLVSFITIIIMKNYISLHCLHC